MNDKIKNCDMANERLREAQKELSAAVAELLPVGSLVNVRRGKGIWIIEVTHHDAFRYAGRFTGKSRTGT